MKFWYTSAVVPSIVREPATIHLRRLTEADPDRIVWWGTRIECASAIAARRRDGSLSESAVTDIQACFAELRECWSEVLPREALRERALRLLEVHSLRAADALQLAAAFAWCRDEPKEHGFVSLDDRLRAAAAREGFDLLPAANPD